MASRVGRFLGRFSESPLQPRLVCAEGGVAVAQVSRCDPLPGGLRRELHSWDCFKTRRVYDYLKDVCLCDPDTFADTERGSGADGRVIAILFFFCEVLLVVRCE